MGAAKTRELYQPKVTLRGISPQIWRRIQVWEDDTLDQLHRVLQVVMGWENYHLCEFRIAGAMYRDPHPENEPEILIAKRTRLRNLLPGAGAEFEYVNDFGDNWQHDLILESILPSRSLWPRISTGTSMFPTSTSAGRSANLSGPVSSRHYAVRPSCAHPGSAQRARLFAQ